MAQISHIQLLFNTGHSTETSQFYSIFNFHKIGIPVLNYKLNKRAVWAYIAHLSTSAHKSFKRFIFFHSKAKELQVFPI